MSNTITGQQYNLIHLESMGKYEMLLLQKPIQMGVVALWNR